MIKPIFYLALPFIAINLKSQPNYFIGLDTIKAPKNLENTSIIPLFHDTINVSSFLIFIKNLQNILRQKKELLDIVISVLIFIVH